MATERITEPEMLMHRILGAAMVCGICLAGWLSGIDRASADIVVNINKSTQRMAVLVDGIEQHVWKVSTGRGGGPPSGAYRPERMHRSWFSRKYDWSPMPHSIFFYKGYAIHGTNYISRLGNRASHGCVRLHPANAKVLFSLVKDSGMAGTTIIISNSDYVAPPVTAPEAGTSESTGSVRGPAEPVAPPDYDE